MISTVPFRTELTTCPYCHRKLVFHRKRERPVRTASGNFTALHIIMKCSACNRRFRSRRLDSIIGHGCTYANDVMPDISIKRFIDGRSCQEISSSSGISESHARRLSNMALDIFSDIHRENTERLKSFMKSSILQIDGTTDADFRMIVVARDAVSGFILMVKRCDSESHESIKGILESVRKQFGDPSGITCDMRAGIISAALETFPKTPIRICLMHFLRELGKDLMRDMHTNLGVMINRMGIKDPLKRIFRDMPDYDQGTLDEIHNGHYEDRGKMEIMSVRRIMEKLVGFTGSSGYGFPFSLKHLNFYMACKEAMNRLNLLSEKIQSEDAKRYISSIECMVKKITDNPEINATGRKLGSVNALFQSLRRMFRVPDKGKLSDEMDTSDDDLIHGRCDIFIEHLNVFLHARIPDHIRTAAKTIIERYRNRESMLFANNPEHTIPRTNNGMERFFRKVRRNVRKRTGNINTGNILAQSGESLALFQNMGNPEYVNIVFGSDGMAKIFGDHRKRLRDSHMTTKMKLELVDRGMEMLMNDSPPGTVYTEDLMKEANVMRNAQRVL